MSLTSIDVYVVNGRAIKTLFLLSMFSAAVAALKAAQIKGNSVRLGCFGDIHKVHLAIGRITKRQETRESKKYK